MTITIASFNVNSVKARLQNLLEWLDESRTDIVLLQELKCVDEAFPAMEIEDRGYNIALHGQKTYNGVAILSKFPLDDVTRGLSGDDSDLQARYIEAVVSVPCAAIRVASVYVPNGQEVGSDKFAYKLAFYQRLREHWQNVLGYGEIAVLGGDFNCAPAAIDVYDAKHLEGGICFHPAEREQLRGLINLGLYDAFRLQYPEKQQFSRWDYRGDGYNRGLGMRIDHLLLSGMAADILRDVWIDETPRAKERPSDHAPVVCSLQLSA